MSKAKELYEKHTLETMTDFDYQYEQFLKEQENAIHQELDEKKIGETK
jgi:hypothetical protein